MYFAVVFGQLQFVGDVGDNGSGCGPAYRLMAVSAFAPAWMAAKGTLTLALYRLSLRRLMSIRQSPAAHTLWPSLGCKIQVDMKWCSIMPSQPVGVLRMYSASDLPDLASSSKSEKLTFGSRLQGCKPPDRRKSG